ncbi:GGDEF domain-containing protein [Ahrensia marina]|uniref:GGDEF domain-containing protein n=1 Tax=Ahrensia marina TaxID=1514904 RepID=UPI000AF41777|nr:GGDEF domain-containing protein [Ahrensia marina]
MDDQSYFQLISPLIFLVFSLGFYLVYHYAREHVSALVFSASYLFGAFGFIFDFLRNLFPETLNYMPANIAYMAMAALFASALSLHYTKRTQFLPLVTMFVCSILISAYYSYIDDHIFKRTFAVNVFGTFILGYPIVSIWKVKKRKIDQIIYGLTIVTALHFPLRAGAILWIESDRLTVENYANSMTSLTLQFTSSVAGLCIAMALLTMFMTTIVFSLRRTSETDTLTGLLNRRGVEAKLPKFEEALAEGVNSHAVLALDIDHFKQVNDTYGHNSGDEVLIACARLLKKLDIEQSIVSRMGGEEFNLILYNANDETAKLAADYVCGAFSQLTHPVIDDKAVTVSIGVSLWSARSSFSDAARLADIALYRAKSEGRNCVRLAHMQSGPYQVRGKDRRSNQAGMVTLRT